MFVEHYYKANTETRIAGRLWYARARLACEELCKRYTIPRDAAAGIIAVLSQRNPWRRNLLAADELCKTGNTTKGLRSTVRKAQRILAGEPARKVIRGPKITEFFYALCGDDTAVVLDSWMSRAAGIKRLEGKRYDRIAQLLRAEAHSVRELPAHFQAIVWCHLRGKAD